MLFNSYAFILIYLPLVFCGYFLIARRSPLFAAAWLTGSSLFYYGWWHKEHLALLLFSIIMNYLFGIAIAGFFHRGNADHSRKILFMAIAVNLLILFYYKYFYFISNAIGTLLGGSIELEKIILPLGISFFTFTQIAFLVDASRGKAKEPNLVYYTLFVTYFPHLIAGPILHHAEMMPQFRSKSTYKINWENLAVGLSIFLIGLFKKTVIADGVSVYVGPVFDAGANSTPAFFSAWGGALAYTLQIYFDFSGYSDMAIGLSRLFGIKLPINFDSPYKSNSISEFWRRWHITLSRFLRDYLYIPLGGNRQGSFRRLQNLFLTMLLGGIWHGAGWTFLLWGALHGLYLVINQIWRPVRIWLQWSDSPAWRYFSMFITFISVVFAWVLFRASDMHTALSIMSGMLGLHGFEPVFCAVSASVFAPSICLEGNSIQIFWIVVLLAICWLFPNTQEIFSAHKPGLISPGYRDINPVASRIKWMPSYGWALVFIAIGLYSIMSISKFSEFIYFIF